MQPSNGAPSSEHWKVVSASFVVKENAAVVLSLDAGGAVAIDVSGGVSSVIVQVWLTGTGSPSIPARTACTKKVCSPAGRSAYSTGVVQSVNSAASRAHW